MRALLSALTLPADGLRPRTSLTLTAVTVVVVLAAIGAAAPTVSAARLTMLIVLGAASIAAALGLRLVAQSSVAERGLLVGQVLLGVAIVVVSRGQAAVAVLPTLSTLVVVAGSRQVAVVAAVYMVSIAAVERASGVELSVVGTNALANATAVLFVVVFSRAMVSEAQARAKSDELASELGEANTRLRAYAARIEDVATEMERCRIAREIHDGLGHSLTVLSVQLEASRMLLEKDPAKALAYVEKAQAVTRQGLADVRGSVAMLREPGTLVAPLAESLGALAEDCRATGLDVRLSVDGPARAVPPPVRATLFRAVQEGLTNVRRHARAGRADVVLNYEEGSILLTITDDGIGATETTEGFGLLGLRERAAILGGHVTLEGKAGQGTRLTLRVPG